MEIDDEPVAEIDIGSSYLTIFYAWNDKQLDPEQDAYKGILHSQRSRSCMHTQLLCR